MVYSVFNYPLEIFLKCGGRVNEKKFRRGWLHNYVKDDLKKVKKMSKVKKTTKLIITCIRSIFARMIKD